MTDMTDEELKQFLKENAKRIKEVLSDDKETAEDMIVATCVLPQTLGASVVLSFDLDITTNYSGSNNPENQ